jgi:hypothetical protein
MGATFLPIGLSRWSQILTQLQLHSSHWVINKKNLVYKKGRDGGTIHKKHKANKGVCHTRCGLAIYIKKYLKKAKEELQKLKYFTMQKYNLQQIL